tara:strand:+ start:468 stop:893 length:426 start_codon:yes stop_codon:yes gene_type:complete
MGEEYYAVIKLVSGEEIFSLVIVEEDQDDPVLLLHHPIKMHIIQTPKGGFIKVNPWMELSNDDMYILKLDKIITITESHDRKLIDVYKRYVDDEESEDNKIGIDIYKSSGKVNISDQMGYISSVEEARESLEKLYNSNKES